MIMTFDYECCYCNKQFTREQYYASDLSCPVCQDKNINKLRADTNDVFGYDEETSGGEADDR